MQLSDESFFDCGSAIVEPGHFNNDRISVAVS